MDVRHLQYFVDVVDRGGFGKAAVHLGISQPSLSHGVRALERECGAPLFHRVGRGVVLSETGEDLLEPARRALQAVEGARTALQRVREVDKGHVSVATSPAFMMNPLVDHICEFLRRHPTINVALTPTDTSLDVNAAVRSAKCELGFTDGRNVGLCQHLVARGEVFVVMPPDSPLRGEPTVSMSMLAGMPFIGGIVGSKTREILELAHNDGIEMPVVVDSPHREAVIPLVVRGVGSAFVPEPEARQAADWGAQIAKLDPPVAADCFMVHRSGEMTPAAKAFAGLVVSAGPQDARVAVPDCVVGSSRCC